MRILTIVVSLLVSVSAYAQGRVGGPCSYDEYSGTCTATGKNADGKVLFVFDGEMRGEKISLADNIADEGFAPDARASCFLMFIKEGTCTPCLFSVGACGERAWDFFREMKSVKSTAETAGRKSGAGCSFSAD